jgi:hypothetical protein
MPRVVIEEADDVRIKFEATVYRVGQGLAKTVFSRAMNSEGRKTFTRVKTALRWQTSIPAKKVNEDTKFINSSPNKLETRTTGRRKYYGLSHFKPKQMALGVGVHVWGKGIIYPHSFIVKSASNNVFIRTSKKRFPLEKMWGPSVHKELMQDMALDTWQRGNDGIAKEAMRLLAHMMAGRVK